MSVQHGEPGTEVGSLLLVEDERIQRELMKDFLEAEGYDVIAAGDGTEAMNLFAQFRDEIGVVISDLRMPGLDGYHLLLEIQKARPGIKVIIVSGHIDARIQSELMREGALAVLQKPLDPGSFLELVRQSLG